MRNVLAILKRDFIRLFKAPAAIVVVLALLVLPSLYTWYNVLGFWDPYNNTGNMRVAVVNQDKGGSHELTGDLDVGALIIDALHENDQLNWQFADYDTAMADLEAGRDYAVFVIPENFTENLLTLLSGDFQQPNIQYYVNMKTGPVSPKITDAGSTTLEETINSTFVKTVSDIVVEAITQALGESQEAISQGSSEASMQVDDAILAVAQARSQLSDVNDTIYQAQNMRSDALTALDEARQALDAVQGDLGEVSQKTTEVQQALVDIAPVAMEAVNKALTALYALEDVAQAAGHGEELQAAISALEKCSEAFFGTMIPAVTQGLGNMSSASAQLQATASSQQLLIDQAKTVLDSLDSALDTAHDALGQTDGLLETLSGDLSTLKVSLLSLAGSNAITSLVENGTLDSDAIANFMSSPTTVVTEKLYEVEVYGFAMAPLFINLTFWIGAFMLLVIMRQEVDAEGIKNLTVAQRYVSRFIMFSLFAVLQSAICCTGLIFLGVHPQNIGAMYFASAMASLAYLSIIYALSVLFQHVGKGLCIILVFMQIPSATGLYPIEMMAGFYQAISPFFPFTYGIGALREAICGFYGLAYVHDIAMLALYFVVFLVLGVCLRPSLAGVNRTFAKQLGESGIYNGEDVEIPARGLRLSWITSALSDQKEYREEMLRRYEHFKSLYPRLIKGAIVFGVVVPVVFGIVLGLTVSEKVTLLTVWLICLVVLLVFLTVVENLREGFERQLSLGDMETPELHSIYSSRLYADAKEDSHCRTSAAATDDSSRATLAVNALSATISAVASMAGESDAPATASAEPAPAAEQTPAAPAAQVAAATTASAAPTAVANEGRCAPTEPTTPEGGERHA